jgi:ferredoxin--NADP+ reductase
LDSQARARGLTRRRGGRAAPMGSLMKPLAYNATMLERIDLTDALSIFRIAPDTLPRTRPWFVAGQYCVLGLNNVDEAALGAVCRPMTIASAPEEDGPIEFYLRRVARPASPNPLTHLLWKLKPGGRIYMRVAAAGLFTINDTVGPRDSRLRVMVASGTGIAPFISMIRSEVRRHPNADLSRWALLHGASSPADLGYRAQLLALRAVHGLKYWGTVSRPAAAPEWTGDVGRVESFFEPSRVGDLEARLGLTPDGLNPDNAAIFVCGLTGTIVATMTPMIDRAFVPDDRQLRKALGVPPEIENSLYFEHYDPQPLVNAGNPAVIEPLRARMQAALARSAARPAPASCAAQTVTS